MPQPPASGSISKNSDEVPLDKSRKGLRERLPDLGVLGGQSQTTLQLGLILGFIGAMTALGADASTVVMLLVAALAVLKALSSAGESLPPFSA